MKQFFLIAIVTISFLYSCDVRKHDMVADEKGLKEEKALKDSLSKINTVVQLIDSVYNFGTIKEGDKVTYSFRFKNIGKIPLVITDAKASCGCTVPEKPEKPVMPGDTSFIKVVFNSKGKHGHNEKHITVTANTYPDFPKLLLIGEVEGEAK